MIESVEHQGRLQRSDGKTVASGTYNLRFRLQPFNRDDVLWEEEIPNVSIATGGGYRVLLGHRTPIPASIFSGSQRVLLVAVLKGGKKLEDIGERSQFAGGLLRVGAAISELESRVHKVEHHPALTGDGQLDRLRRRLRRTMKLVHELKLTGGAPLQTVGSQVGILEERMTRLDGEEGRVIRLEDDLEDLTGPDGELTDLGERVEGMEARLGTGPVIGRGQAVTQEKLDLLNRRIDLVEQRLASPPSPEVIGAVARSGDTMTGELVVQKGGLHVAAGLFKARTGELNNLDVSGQLRVHKLVAAGVELRGDLQVDTPTRVLHVRFIEGRAVPGRLGGPLHLNGREGGEVVVGRADLRAGLQVHGALRADRVEVGATGYAETFVGVAAPGEVVSLAGPGRAVAPSVGPDNRRVIGVVSEEAAVLAGQPAGTKAVRVVLRGTAVCRVVGPISWGDLLVASSVAGRACRADQPAPGALLGRALADAEGEVEIPVLVGG